MAITITNNSTYVSIVGDGLKEFLQKSIGYSVEIDNTIYVLIKNGDSIVVRIQASHVTGFTTVAQLQLDLIGYLSTNILSGTTAVNQQTTAVGTTVSVAFSVLSADATGKRKSVIVNNNTNKTLLIGLGFTPTSSNYLYSLTAGSVLEVPSGSSCLSVSVIWIAGGAANGGVVVGGSIIP